MKLPTAPTVHDKPLVVPASVRAIRLVPMLCFVLCSVAFGQIAQPTATPVEIALPLPTATPSPNPATTPQFTVTPGLPDPSVMAAYVSARTPTVTVTLNNVPVVTPITPTTASAAVTSASATSNAVAAGVKLHVSGGVASQTTLVAPADGKNSKTSSATTNDPSPAAVPVAMVVLGYDASHAGESITVVTTSGGALWINSTDNTAPKLTASLILTIDPTGMIMFNYQAPGPGNTYQVVTRLDNVQTVIPFVVPDPNS